MNDGKLFVSFWNVCVDNFPLGTFRHRSLLPEDARRYIDDARHKGKLLCVSEDDLLAPCRTREREEHEALCTALSEHFGIALTSRDFLAVVGEDSLYTIRPLTCVQILGNDQLLVISCSYVFGKAELEAGPVFAI